MCFEIGEIGKCRVKLDNYPRDVSRVSRCLEFGKVKDLLRQSDPLCAKTFVFLRRPFDV